MQKGKIKIDKNIKITLLILLVYLVVMLIIFLPGYLKSKYEKLYIVTNRYKIKYEDGSWKNIDKTEENRTYDGVEEVRKIAEKDLDKVIIKIIDYVVEKAIKLERPIHPDTIEVRNKILTKVLTF